MKLQFLLGFGLALLSALCGCGTTGAAGSGANATSSLATPTGSHKVVLTWAASTSSVTGYNVYRASTQPDSYVLLTSQPVNALTYTDSTVQSGQTYYYAVTAIDANGVQSALSNQVTAAVP